MTTISPIYTQPADFINELSRCGYVVFAPGSLAELLAFNPYELDALKPSWENLPLDNYLKDGGRYRQRRHSCFIINRDHFQQTPHRQHWQPLQYNALHGGQYRLFEPIAPDITALPVWHKLLTGIAALCAQLRGGQTWYVEAHQFRIDTKDGIGRPTPEGAHRDGVDFVAILMVERQHIKGGESRIFDANASNGQRFTMTKPWTLLLLDDARVIHESTPIQPTAQNGYRDTLVLTYRLGGFQEQLDNDPYKP